MGRRRALTVSGAAGLLLLAAQPARAEDRDFCADRPGQTTPPCTLAPGQVMIETAASNWTRESDPESRTDMLTLGSSLLRVGVASRLEAQVGWTPYGTRWVRDTASGTVARQSGTGDVTLGLTYGLAGANGPVALQGFVTLPTGGAAIGAGDWGAGLRLPAQLPLSSSIDLTVTPEIDVAVNQSGSGRHLSYGGAAGLGFALTREVNLGVDVALFRDEDPDGVATLANAGLSLAWQAGQNTQLDVGGTVGFNRDSPDGTAYLGIAHRF